MEDKILENITKSIGDRLKIPIVITYVSVLIIYNWDILFYLFFENTSASIKIQSIKSDYGCVYYSRIFYCVFLAIILIVLFTMLNTFLNYCLKWFYRKDKEITSEIENFEKIAALNQELSQLIDENKILKTEKETQQNIIQNLTSKNMNLSISHISKTDFERLINVLNTFENKEKLLFSFRELLERFKKNIEVRVRDIYDIATYSAEMELLVNILRERNLLSIDERLEDGHWENYFDLSPSFKDFLEMEI